MRGHSRSKNGVLSHAYDPRIHDEVQHRPALRLCTLDGLMDCRVSPGNDIVAGKEDTMDIDLPDVVAEVRAAFDRYEKALVSNDVPALDELFRDDPRTIRYGAGEILYGHSEIKSFRSARSPVALGRKLSRTVITTFGREFAVASTLYERPSAPGKIGRQMQTWVKFPEGWRVVAAHVSLMDKPV
jgi:1-carboxybiuret hydrolase subunit AtzH-like protein